MGSSLEDSPMTNFTAKFQREHREGAWAPNESGV